MAAFRCLSRENPGPNVFAGVAAAKQAPKDLGDAFCDIVFQGTGVINVVICFDLESSLKHQTKVNR